MRRPTMIILCCLAVLAGTFLGYYYYFTPNVGWLIFGVIAIIGSLVLSKKVRFIPLICVSIVVGIWLVTNILTQRAEYGLSGHNYQKIIINGTIKGDPYWDKDRNYVFTLNDLKINDQSKYGELRVKTFSAAGKEGNRVRVKGKVFPISARPGHQISYASVEVINNSQPALVQIKQLLYAGADRALNENTANFIKGLLVGARSSLSQSSQDTLNSVGLSHIVAVSGYNLTILVVVLQRLLKKRWLWGSLIISLVLVWLFTLLTGASASIVRSAIMASTFLVASYYGRPLSIFTSISMTAVLTLLANPLVAIEDIGWQLSFLSLLGIVILTPIIQKFLPKKLTVINEILAVTLAAQLATIPYVMYLFGSYSIMAFVANIILMPLIPILMFVGFVASVLGLLIPMNAYILGQPINWLVDELFKFLVYLQGQQEFIVHSRPQLTMLLAWYSCLSILGIIVYHRRLLTTSVAFHTPEQMLK